MLFVTLVNHSQMFSALSGPLVCLQQLDTISAHQDFTTNSSTWGQVQQLSFGPSLPNQLPLQI